MTPPCACPNGETGTVIGVKEITREDAEEDGDELPNGVNQMIRVYIAQHRKITVGDKLSGRHGNKGLHLPHPAGRGHAVPGWTVLRSTSC